MHLLQFSQSIDSPTEIYVAFQWDPLLWPSLPPPQEGHGDTRVLGQMPSDPLRCTSTSKNPHPSPLQDNQPRAHWNTTHQTWITSIARSPACSFSFLSLSLFFYSINNSKCKSPEQMLREKKKRSKKNRGRWGGWGGQKERGKKNTRGEQNNPAGPPLPLEASEVTLCFCEGACEQNGLWSWVTALYCGITTATTKPLQKCAGWL